MRRLRSVFVGLLALTLFPGTLGCIVVSVSFEGSDLPSQALPQGVTNRLPAEEPDVVFSSSQPSTTTGPAVILGAASRATIRFKTQNGQAVGDVPPQTLDLPHLVLCRDGVLTAPEERTLIVEVSGIEVPPAGVTITLKVETQHGDPDLGGDPSDRIPVWSESQGIANTSGVTQMGITALFRHEFTEAVTVDGTLSATPTDYFRYDIAVIDAGRPVASSQYAISLDYAFLMESQWIARLPEVQEAPEGAAPDEVAVYTCDMVPFRKSPSDSYTWLLRKDVPDYVSMELVPQMVEAFRVQTDVWGFLWAAAPGQATGLARTRNG